MGVSWTLRHELLFYSFIALLIFNRRIGATLFGAWAILLFGALPHWGNLPFPLSFLLSPHNIEFLFGMLAAEITCRALGWPVASLWVGAALYAFAATVDVLTTAALTAIVRPLYAVASLGLILGLAGSIRHHSTCPGLLRLGEASFAIYLVHHPLPAIPAPPFVLFLLTAGIALAAGLFFHACLERPLIEILRNGLLRTSELPPTRERIALAAQAAAGK
jgi:peptidoglycan/LPS O-acetylase OafA/YrhL